ncbi:Tel2p ASCRUDRAFT_68993 [Ascoidea rubescens DSM 1968]|uniref:Telomere length regulation protein conserved domain-containing protein n=1 Tax=Ascoidea rubescens DSM 1968 TaxID=1344418 RepID=A0A1D2VKN2_9ASCO|nr:hypothetical protein ASCRUDRAFT_68993 [Ascoidea rubescens DSM 1968]ODV62162.1 hypothetical protein ASCRUDRAFT_68993 [Ascoidea rubescens DSM 1968]
MKELLTAIESLKDQLPLQRLDVVLTSFIHNREVLLQSRSINFKLVSTLLSHTVPRLYPLVADDGLSIKPKIVSLLNNLVGLNHVLNCLSLLNASFLDDSCNPDSSFVLMSSYLDIILLIIEESNDHLVSSYLHSQKYSNQSTYNLTFNEIKSIFFGSRLFQIVNNSVMICERRNRHILINNLAIFHDVELFLKTFLINQMHYLMTNQVNFNLNNNYSNLVQSFLYLHPVASSILFDNMLISNVNNLNSFINYYNKITLNQKMSLNYLLPYLFKTYPTSPIPLIYFFHKFSLNNHSVIVPSIFDNLLNNSLHSQIIIFTSFVLNSKSSNNHLQLFSDIIQSYWADPNFIKKLSLINQEILARFLLVFLNFFKISIKLDIQNNNDLNLFFFLKHFLLNQNLLFSVNERLNLPNEKLRFLGMIIIQEISSIISNTISQNTIDSTLDEDFVSIDFHINQLISYKTELLNFNKGIYQKDLSQDFNIFTNDLLNNKYYKNIDSDQFILNYITSKNPRNIENQLQTQLETKLETQALNLEKLSLNNNSSITPQKSYNYFDSDDEDLNDAEYNSDDYDDPSIIINKNSKPMKPVYIKDLISYLNDDSSLEKRRIALKECANLLRFKNQFSDEINFYSVQLARLLMNLTSDKFNLNKENENDVDVDVDKGFNFEELRLKSLVSCIISNVEQVPEVLIKLIFTGDFSIQQRISILSSLSLAARELRGFNDNVAYNSNTIKSYFPTKTLPKHLHDQFLLLDEDYRLKNNPSQNLLPLNSGVEILSAKVSDDLMISGQKRVKDELIKQSYSSETDNTMLKEVGKVLRVSSVLQKKNNLENKFNLHHLSNITDKYSKIAGKYFFFPLIGLSFNVFKNVKLHSKLDTFSVLFTSQLVKTLGLLLHASYPKSTDLQEMIKELFDVLNLLKFVAQNDTILEAHLFCLSIILENTNEDILVKNHSKVLLNYKDWLEHKIKDTIKDDKINLLFFNCLVYINNLIEKYKVSFLIQI